MKCYLKSISVEVYILFYFRKQRGDFFLNWSRNLIILFSGIIFFSRVKEMSIWNPEHLHSTAINLRKNSQPTSFQKRPKKSKKLHNNNKSIQKAKTGGSCTASVKMLHFHTHVSNHIFLYKCMENPSRLTVYRHRKCAVTQPHSTAVNDVNTVTVCVARWRWTAPLKSRRPCFKYFTL